MANDWKQQLVAGYRENIIREFGDDVFILRKVTSNTDLDELYGEETINGFSIGTMKATIGWPQNVPVIAGFLFMETQLPIKFFPEYDLALDADQYKVSIAINDVGARFQLVEENDKLDWRAGRFRKQYTLVPDRNED